MCVVACTGKLCFGVRLTSPVAPSPLLVILLDSFLWLSVTSWSGLALSGDALCHSHVSDHCTSLFFLFRLVPSFHQRQPASLATLPPSISSRLFCPSGLSWPSCYVLLRILTSRLDLFVGFDWTCWRFWIVCHTLSTLSPLSAGAHSPSLPSIIERPRHGPCLERDANRLSAYVLFALFLVVWPTW